MSRIHEPASGLLIGDPDRLPLSRETLPSPAELEAALGGMILSASGWRKVFGSPLPGEPRAPWASSQASPAAAAAAAAGAADEDSLTERVAPADLVLAAGMALVFLDKLRSETGRPDPAILLGVDSRPTGPALADIMCRVLLASGARPRYLFVVAAPEIMASARAATLRPAEDPERAEGFVYVSASHNPPAHNGVKFGRGGGVLPAAEVQPLVEAFKARVRDPAFPSRVLAMLEDLEPRALARLYSGVPAAKRRSVSDYALFAREVVTGETEPEAQEELLGAMEAGARDRPLGVLAELNGSARSLSIDADFLGGCGVRTMSRNAVPRAFSHRIVPEGESLDEARAALAEARAADPAFSLGYVPDCDGDRGNLVFHDSSRGESRALEAQEVFALCCVAELAGVERSRAAAAARGLPRDGRPVAVAVNDATSLRIEAVAKAFGAEVHRAETGEANVVGLADSLRARGYLVRILGEGSNGGNITHPAQVRDPLATLGAMLKLLLLRGEEGGEEGLWRTWLRRSGREELWSEDYELGDIVASLPAWASTSVFEPRAALRIRSSDQVALKARYRDLFLRDWALRRAELESRLGIVAWEARASKGSGESPVGEDFAASGKGGLRILLKDARGRDKGFLWMRGSGTEPVFRIMADIEGGRAADEEWLLAWQTAMVREADGS